MNNKRREFLKILGGSALVFPAAIATGKSFAFAEEGKEVSLEDPIAKALGYYSDATKVDLTAYPKKKGPDGDKQFCSNCMLLSQTGLSISGKEGVYGKCTVITTGLVNSKGWCNSWVQKPGA
jgi:hypothetical protein